MRILFISAYYPPLNAIASHRIKGFTDSCDRLGIPYDVITRKYDDNQVMGNNMFIASQKPMNFEEDFMMSNNVYYTNFNENNEVFKFSNNLPSLIRGVYNYFKIDVYHYGWLDYVFKVFKEQLIDNKYDFIISSYGPPIALLAAKKLSRKYGIPYVIDFRDSYIEGSEKFLHKIIKKWQLKSLIKYSSACIFASDGMRDIFNSEIKDKRIISEIIYNGTTIDKDDFFLESDEPVVAEFNRIKNNNDIVLLHSGTIYNGQEIKFFIDCLNDFLLKFSEIKIALVFLGLPENNLTQIYNEKFIYYLPRVSFKTSNYILRRASALLAPVWKNRYTGFSGKIFEYLSLGNCVIIGPNPQNDIKLFVSNYTNSFICNEPIQFQNLLLKLKSSTLKSNLPINVDFLSRKFWSDRFISFLFQLKN